MKNRTTTRRTKKLDKGNEARRAARNSVGEPPGTRIRRDKRKDPPRAQNPFRKAENESS